MIDLRCHSLTLAVFPVLVGPLQTLLALLPAILLGVGSMLFAALKPAGFVKLVRFCWRQKWFLGCVAVVVVGWRSGFPAKLVFGPGRSTLAADGGARTDWSTDRGGIRRLGRGPGDSDPTTATAVWKNDRDKTVLSSPAVTGDRVIFTTATDIGPFTPAGRGAIVCVDAHSGKEIWRYAPDNYRATFSSPVVHENFVVCGEGLHQVEDARVTCLDLSSGAQKWEFRTKSHVESTAAIADGRVFIGAGDDGFYCLSLEPLANGQPQVVWHLNGDEFRDCESSPLVSEGVVYFGLGEGGFAVCAVDANTGTLLWRVETPYPVFAPPAIANEKLYIATGNGNYVQSAADLLEMKLQVLRDDGASEQQLAEARQRLKPVGEVWSIDLATHAVDWKFETGDAILGAVVSGEDSLYFGSRDGHLYRVSPEGRLIHKFDLREPIVASPALGQKHVYCATASGRLFCLEAATLKPVWDASLGGGETFSSSPAIAHGHVYIGTAQQGLRCLGQPGTPEPPLWTNGERGGGADDGRVPESLAVLWQFPSEGATPLIVTAPLMPLEEALYVAGTREGQHEFIKLDAAPAVEQERRQVWSRRFDGSITVPPVGSGRRLCVVEGTSSTSTKPRLHCLSADDGQIIWSESLTDLPSGMTVDSQRVYVWAGVTRLRCLNLANGYELWDVDEAAVSSAERRDYGSPVAPPTGRAAPAPSQEERPRNSIGGPLVSNQIVVAATESSLFARDALTGCLLWEVALEQPPHGGPIVNLSAFSIPFASDSVETAREAERLIKHQMQTAGLQFVLPYRGKLVVYNVVDGSRADSWTASEVDAQLWHLVTDAFRPVTPRVSINGRVYFGAEHGAIVCLGAEQP